MFSLVWRYSLWDRNNDNIVLLQEIHISSPPHPETLKNQAGPWSNSAPNKPGFSPTLLEDISATRKHNLRKGV